MSNSIPLGTVIAERHFLLYDTSERAIQVTVLLGKPAQTKEPFDSFQCPIQIIGLDFDEKIFAPHGEDSFVALQYAIDLAGQLLDQSVQHLNLQNHCPNDPHPTHPDSWIWRYDRQLSN